MATVVVAASPALAQQDGVTIYFELAVEGVPPADATFFGQYLVEGASVQPTNRLPVPAVEPHHYAVLASGAPSPPGAP